MNDTAQAIAAALEAVDAVPEKYQVAAFVEILKMHLGQVQPGGLQDSDADEAPAAKISTMDEASLPEAHVVAESDSREQETVWAVMHLRKRGIQADTEAIREEIQTYLSRTPQNRQNTARTLRALTPRYLIREKSGKGYSYQASAHALDIFRDNEGEA